MKALTKGQYRGSDGIWAVFDLEWGAELRVGILEPDIGRVVLKRDGGYRLDRGWSIAPGGLEPAFEGRHRDSTEGFACPASSISEEDGRVTLAEAQAAALAHFDRADTNRDGRITPDEHRKIRMMRIERRQG